MNERDLERRLDELDAILKYDVLRKHGPWAERFESLETAVQKMVNQAATKKEVEEALEHQTDELKRETGYKFTRRQKIAGSFLAIGLFILEVYQVAFH